MLGTLLWFVAGVLYLAAILFAQGWLLTASQPHALACVAGGLLATLLTGAPAVVAHLRPPPAA